MYKTSVVLKALPKDRVSVRNYKSKYNTWESGVVMDVETKFNGKDDCVTTSIGLC